jgi:DNA-binding transcriptional regulator YiaG
VLGQLQRLAAMLRRGPARTRAEAIRQITRKLQLQADEFAAVLEARDAKLRGK